MKIYLHLRQARYRGGVSADPRQISENDPEHNLEENNLLIDVCFVWVNGIIYEGNDLTVTEGDNFSWNYTWSPNFASKAEPALREEQMKKYWRAGGGFRETIFTFPGLNLIGEIERSLVINGINAGDWKLTYDKKTGEMEYVVVFNEYIKFFDPDTVLAQLEGSGQFKGTDGGKIQVGDYEGGLSVQPRPPVETGPNIPVGSGWQAAKPPEFTNNPYPFGKGVKWTSENNPDREPQIDWRAVYFNPLQKKQQEFLENGDIEIEESEKYCIITDTLDENQRFLVSDHSSDTARFDGVPFHLELPVIAVGTDRLLNGRVGNGAHDGAYDGPGEIVPYIPGSKFKEIKVEEEGNAELAKQQVKTTPLTWTVTSDPQTRRQTLTINVGKLGVKDPTKGITWKAGNNETWWEAGLNKLIKECDEKSEALMSGQDSPIKLLDDRHQSAVNYLLREVGEENQALAAWREEYKEWRQQPKVQYLTPLITEKPNGEVEKIELPDKSLLENLGNINLGTDEKPVLFNTKKEYQNIKVSYEELYDDQALYLKNRHSYREQWETAKERYEKTLEFYKETHPGVWGFTIKIRSEVINTSMSSYTNRIQIDAGDFGGSAEDTSKVRFANGVIGDYISGSVVLQKADALYETEPEEGADDKKQEQIIEDIQKVEDKKAGLAKTVFKVYGEEAGSIDETKVAHFLPKDASANKNAYTLTHLDGEESPHHIEGEVTELETDARGKLVLSGLVPGDNYYLKEQTAPDGYYKDNTPIKITKPLDSDQTVTYGFLPNVSRSVKLYKADSYSKQPVKDAEFKLYKIDGTTETEVTGFSKTTINGHDAFVKTKGADDTTLLTNENGELCIHGLDAGTYKLKEIEAPGYQNPVVGKDSFKFTLAEDLPKKTDGDPFYDEDYHYCVNTKENPLMNDPKTASITLTKKSGLLDTPSLSGAHFTLFRFTGSEDQWKANPDKINMWKAVEVSDSNGGKYFHTSDSTGNVNLDGLPAAWKEPNLPTVITGDDGKLEITDIPIGHYSIAEVKAPDDFVRDYHSYYFDITPKNVENDSIQLYNGLGEDRSEVAANTLYNYKDKAQIALVKYDEEEEPPEIDGDVYGTDGNTWKYQGTVIEQGQGLQGATYKLFRRMGGTDQINPNPKELNTVEIVGPDKENPTFDECLAVGTTNGNGTLHSHDMTDEEGTEIGGLNLEEYYLIEVKAPEGYVLDQTPIHFSLTTDIFPDNPTDYTPGLIKRVSNKQYDYGIRIIKKDASTETTTLPGQENPEVYLKGAEFTITKEGASVPLNVSPQKDGTYKADENGSDKTMVTDEKGEIIITGLDPGTKYELQETKAPQGYEPSEKSIFVTTKEQNEIIGEEAKESLQLVSQEVENTRLKGKMILHKQDAETGAALEGAVYQLYKTVVTTLKPGDPDYDPTITGEQTRSEDVKIEGKTGTTDKNGEVTFDNLEWEEYYYVLEEKAPEGYTLDQTKLSFTIDEKSFDKEGKPIPVVFPRVGNSKGTMGEFTLKKVDLDDQDRGLEDAHFFLSKKIVDSAGIISWVTYGQGMYKTDKEGLIRFKLPPGEYMLTEMKAPDGYLIPDTENFEKYFKITEAGQVRYEDEPIEEGILKITNEKGEAGLLLKKVVEGIDRPLAGVKFKFYFGSVPSREILKFSQVGDGVYEADENGTIDTISTDENGEIRLRFSSEYIPGTELEEIINKQLFYQEVSLPENVKDNLVLDSEIKSITGSTLTQNMWVEQEVENKLTDEVKQSIKIQLNKLTGKTKRGLPGATFQLNKVDIKFEGIHFETEIDKQTTDEYGNITFGEKLELGQTYHIVEVEAPEGYALDKTHHEIVLDDRCFTENLEFTVPTITAHNYEDSAHVALKKTDEESRPLQGAEFELFRNSAVTDTGEPDEDNPQWEHYGNYRYVTNEGGMISGTLPLGHYKWVETAAPIGYELPQDPLEIEFNVTDTNQVKYPEGVETVPGDPSTAIVKNKQYRGSKGSVTVMKVDMDKPNKRLEGAEFQLYVMDSAGEYHLYHTQTHKTDKNGKFIIDNLPAGSYAFKEVIAPEGYGSPDPDKFYPFSIADKAGEHIDLSIENGEADGRLSVSKSVTGGGDKNKEFSFTVTLDNRGIDGEYGDMTFKEGVASFTLKHGETKTAEKLPRGTYYEVKEGDHSGYTMTSDNAKGTILRTPVEVTFNNEKYSGGGSVPDPDTAVAVQKIWEDGNSENRPDSVKVQLYQNGAAYGDPVSLSSENSWTHTWEGLPEGHTWTVDEPEVPQGYRKTVTEQEGRWIITNTEEGEDPDKPSDPDDPSDPEDPDDPSGSIKPNDPNRPGGNDGSSNLTKPNRPGTVPKPNQVLPSSGIGKGDQNAMSHNRAQTGDETPLGLWTGLMLLTAAGMAAAALYRRPKKQK